MEIINIKYYDNFLEEYIELCLLEWGNSINPEEKNVENKKRKIYDGDKVISILGLIDNDILIGFISLLKYDGEERRELSPWYATMYVKKEYRNKGYSRLLNGAILKEAHDLGYKRVYLKTDKENYYEKFGAKYIDMLSNGEKLYYFDLENPAN